MGIFEEDIDGRIRRDFGAEAETAFARLRALRGELDSGGARILRCILFLSRGDLDLLDQFIQLARVDWRDVIVSAEYEIRPGTRRSEGICDQARDFNLPFQD